MLTQKQANGVTFSSRSPANSKHLKNIFDPPKWKKKSVFPKRKQLPPMAKPTRQHITIWIADYSGRLHD
jgi:hypothetical protein